MKHSSQDKLGRADAVMGLVASVAFIILGLIVLKGLSHEVRRATCFRYLLLWPGLAAVVAVKNARALLPGDKSHQEGCQPDKRNAAIGLAAGAAVALIGLTVLLPDTISCGLYSSRSVLFSAFCDLILLAFAVVAVAKNARVLFSGGRKSIKED